MEINKEIELEFAHIDVTDECNLGCKYCFYYEGNNREETHEPSLEEIKKTIDECESLGVKTIAISGGEPLLREDIEEIVDYGISRKIILTNGTINNERIKDLIKNNKRTIKEIRVSLDGFRGHDYVTGVKGCHKKVIDFITFLGKLDVQFTICTVVGKHNLNEVTSIYNFVKKCKAYRWDLGLPMVAGRMKNKPIGVYLEDETEAFIVFSEIIQKYLKEKPLFKLNIVKFFYSELLELGDEELEELFSYNPNEHPCEYALKSITIKTNGDVCLCPGHPITFGNINKKSLKSILTSETAQKFYNLKIDDFNDCKKCRYFLICKGGCMADFRSPIPKRDFCISRLELFEKYILPVLPRKLKLKLQKYISK